MRLSETTYRCPSKPSEQWVTRTEPIQKKRGCRRKRSSSRRGVHSSLRSAVSSHSKRGPWVTGTWTFVDEKEGFTQVSRTWVHLSFYHGTSTEVIFDYDQEILLTQTLNLPGSYFSFRTSLKTVHRKSNICRNLLVVRRESIPLVYPLNVSHGPSSVVIVLDGNWKTHKDKVISLR